jgi:antitoxin PrlF
MSATHYIMNLTSKGQVTVPAAVRRLLGLQPGQPVTFEIRDGEVRLMPSLGGIQAVFGSVKPLSRPEDFERMAEIAQEEHAAAVVREAERASAVR